jgi:hypothetical protein
MKRDQKLLYRFMNELFDKVTYITVLLTYLWTVMILLRLFQESKNIIFTCGDSKNHSWPSPLVIFSVPTRENNVFLLSFHRTVILHYCLVSLMWMKIGSNDITAQVPGVS